MSLFGGLFGGSGDSKTTTSQSTSSNVTQNNDNKVSNDGGGSVITSGGGNLTQTITNTGVQASDAFGFTRGLVSDVLAQHTTETGALSDLAKAGFETLAGTFSAASKGATDSSNAALSTLAAASQGGKIPTLGLAQYAIPLALVLGVCAVVYFSKGK